MGRHKDNSRRPMDKNRAMDWRTAIINVQKTRPRHLYNCVLLCMQKDAHPKDNEEASSQIITMLVGDTQRRTLANRANPPLLGQISKTVRPLHIAEGSGEGRGRSGSPYVNPTRSIQGCTGEREEQYGQARTSASNCRMTTAHLNSPSSSWGMVAILIKPDFTLSKSSYALSP